METAQATEYAVTLQTPGGMFRGNMRLRMDEHTAGGMLMTSLFGTAKLFFKED